jgi:hypothetical protein
LFSSVCAFGVHQSAWAFEHFVDVSLPGIELALLEFVLLIEFSRAIDAARSRAFEVLTACKAFRTSTCMFCSGYSR